MTTLSLPMPTGGAGTISTPGGMAGTAQDLGGRIVGGIVGGALGSIFGPLGTLAGRAIGSRVGPLVARAAAAALGAMMESANEAAEEELSSAKEDEEVCTNCVRQDCIDLENKMKDELYANKRGPSGEGKHGLRLRRAEQICGGYGPGQEKMDSIVKRGQRVIRRTFPWDTHRDEIAKQQKRLRELLQEYEVAGCKGHADENVNLGHVKEATEPEFNPTDSEWLGPDHPLCENLSDIIRKNPTPELPRFPRGGSKKQTTPGPTNMGDLIS